jgi:hypothetical protein
VATKGKGMINRGLWSGRQLTSFDKGVQVKKQF